MLLGQSILHTTILFLPICWVGHVLPSALPCHTLSSDCSLPVISQPCSPPPPCLWLPMLFSTTLVYFLSLWRTAPISVFSDSSEGKQKWHNQLKMPQARCVVVSCFSAASNVLVPARNSGSLARSKCNQPSRTLQSHRSGMETHDIQVCKYCSEKLLEE